MIKNLGKFGNQIFQYATLYAIAKEKNYSFGVPYQMRSNNELLDFCLSDAFNLSAEDCTNVFFSSVFVEKEFKYDPNIFNISDNCELHGYFQTEKYFKKYKKDLVEKELMFNDNIQNKVNNIVNKNDSEFISVHMRLGDYVTKQDCHPICSAEYYKTALNLLPKDAKIILFSDEYDKALPFFQDLKINVAHIGTNDKFVDMCMMTKCDYHVIANSSYSWWGAWLSNSKKVIAPKIWFGPSSNIPKFWNDIYCEGWEIV